ncbi:MAG TPA: amino acid permease [Rhodothermales bacterium]|nr:amino acid permease [Rhodothermales bacterium]
MIEIKKQLFTSDEHSVTKGRKKFGTFGGVFTPTLLTILGVIMYLREGWVIGNAGILGGLLIISLAFLITTCTGLSMSSITTNIRIGSGGAYAIVSQSLGLEVGGSLGIPRYVSQAFAITLYIFGFREGWLWVFPTHHAFLVDLVVLLVLWGIAYKSADLAIKTQYVILAIIVVSLVSIGLAAAYGSMQYDVENVGLWGAFPGSPSENGSGTTFWTIFAVFFPAATGIMAGANMSGDLKDPRRSIPIGTMAAIGVSFVIYVLLAYWLARSATPEELVNNYYVMVDKAFWGPAVIAGLLGATFSSALASMVGAGRILQAMGDHRILPGSPWLGALTPAGEPRNAMLVTGGIVFASLLLRDLNAIAPLITMFFLITYAMLNVVVLIEQGLGLVSFRPLLRVPVIIPWIGLLGSVYVMFIINPIISLVSVGVVVAFYGVLARQRLDAPFEDVRSGLFVSFAEWAAKKVTEMPTSQERAWKPNLLVPVEDPNALRGVFTMIQNITYPKGSVKLLGIPPVGGADGFDGRIATLAGAFRKHGVFASGTVVDNGTFGQSVGTGLQVLKGAFFQPNIVFLPLPATQEREATYKTLIRQAAVLHLGILLYAPHPVAQLGQRQSVNVWIRDRSPDWRLRWDIGNLDLSILTAYKLKLNWGAHLRLITVLEDEAEEEKARNFMSRLMDLARLPSTEVIVAKGSFNDYVSEAPQADINIFGLTVDPDFTFLRHMVDQTHASCIFILDSGQESALA